MSIYSKIKRLLLIFYPAKCINCGEVIENKNPFCENCSKKFPPTRRLRYIEINNKKIKCISAFHYGDKIREAICDFKFRDRKNYAGFFAASISEVLLPEDEVKKFNYITAVPLSKQRYKERGYNQAELVAKDLCERIDIEYNEILEKIKDNKTQHTLNLEERKVNVKGVYATSKRFDLRGKNVIICDDIITTGNTLSECVKMLMDSGCENILCLTTADAS